MIDLLVYIKYLLFTLKIEEVCY